AARRRRASVEATISSWLKPSRDSVRGSAPPGVHRPKPQCDGMTASKNRRGKAAVLACRKFGVLATPVPIVVTVAMTVVMVWNPMAWGVSRACVITETNRDRRAGLDIHHPRRRWYVDDPRSRL